MRLIAALLFLVLADAAPVRAERPAMLVYSGTTGYRHDSIEAGVEALRTIADDRGLDVIATEDPRAFRADRLKRFRVIVFLSSTTDRNNRGSEWLADDGRSALQQFVRDGGGILAIHAAADSHYHWPWYGRLIGARFARHPPGTPRGQIALANPSHPANRHLPKTAERSDEWYYFEDYDPTSTLLVTLDPVSIGEQDVNPNPVAWAREVDGGRVFYTAMGHTVESYSDPYFLKQLGNGLDWLLAGERAANSPRAAASPPPARTAR